MRDDELISGSLETEFIPVDLRRVTVEEFELGDGEPCIASSD